MLALTLTLSPGEREKRLADASSAIDSLLTQTQVIQQPDH